MQDILKSTVDVYQDKSRVATAFNQLAIELFEANDAGMIEDVAKKLAVMHKENPNQKEAIPESIQTLMMFYLAQAGNSQGSGGITRAVSQPVMVKEIDFGVQNQQGEIEQYTAQMRFYTVKSGDREYAATVGYRIFTANGRPVDIANTSLPDYKPQIYTKPADRWNYWGLQTVFDVNKINKYTPTQPTNGYPR